MLTFYLKFDIDIFFNFVTFILDLKNLSVRWIINRLFNVFLYKSLVNSRINPANLCNLYTFFKIRLLSYTWSHKFYGSWLHYDSGLTFFKRFSIWVRASLFLFQWFRYKSGTQICDQMSQKSENESHICWELGITGIRNEFHCHWIFLFDLYLIFLFLLFFRVSS